MSKRHASSTLLYPAPHTVTLGSASTMQVQNTPHFAAVQTEGALYPLMSHQERVNILKSEIDIEMGVSLFKMLTLLFYLKFYTQWVPVGYHNKFFLKR
jgi:hypothetical protein